MGTHVRERESYVREFVMVERELLRRRMEAAIEAMLVMLDELDGDPDLEPNGDDEPSLGCTMVDLTSGWIPFRVDGWRDDDGSQLHWAEGAFDDAEGDEHDGREPDGCVATMAA